MDAPKKSTETCTGRLRRVISLYLLQYFFDRGWVSRVADQWFDINDRYANFLFGEGREQLQDEIRARRETAFASTAMCNDLTIDVVFLEELCELLGNDHDPVAAISANDTNLEFWHGVSRSCTQMRGGFQLLASQEEATSVFSCCSIRTSQTASG